MGHEPLEDRLLLSGLGDFLNPPAFVPAPSDPGQPGPSQAAVADTQERRDLIYLAQHVPTAEFPILAQVDTPLLLLYSRRLQGSTQPVGQNTIYGTPYGDLFSTDGARPHVQAFVQSASVARSALEALGMQVTAVTATADWQVVAGYLPVDAIGDAAHLAGLGVLQASERGTTEAQGAASNQWETVSYADQLKRVLTSVDGNEPNIDARIEIGVISDSINQVGGGVAASQNTGDLPLGNRVQVLDDGPAGGKDEGRAMAELVYDVGPQFNILFHSGHNSAADMAAAYDDLRQAGADIITEDWTYFTEPVFQDGQIAGAVDGVYLDHGVLVFGAAGNYNNRSYYATWRDDDGDGFHELADGDETLRITLANGEKLRVYLQWSQLWALGTTDIDLQLFSADLSTLLVDSNGDNNPPLLGLGDFGFGTPLESLTYTNNSGAAASYQMAFRFEDGTAPDGLALQMFAPKDKNFPGGSVFTEAYTQNQPGIPGNHAAANMFTIGAVGYPTPTAIEGFSSHGPQTLFFGAGGIGVAEVREKPDFVAADRVDTTFFGSNDNDGSGFNDFFGTSAASPNAAAVAGLVLDAAGRRLSYAELSQIFAQTATGTGAGAWDPAYGNGLINALGAGLVARGFPHEEAYVELNPFGDDTVRGDFSSDTDTDGYAFALESDGQVAFQVIGGGGGQEPGLILWSSESGSLVDIGYDGYPRIQRELASWELYQAELFEQTTPGPNVDSYSLEIDGPEPQRTSIGLNAFGDGSARGAMENRRNADYFRIVAPETAGNALTVVLTPEAALNGVLTLYDADGDELARQDAAAAGQAETIAFGSVVKGATYYLRVGAARYASAGNYELEVAFEMALPAAMTDAEGFAYFHSDGTSHDTQTFSDFPGKADITNDVDVDSFFFAGEAAGEYTVSVTPRSGDVAPLVAVYNAATGELLGSTATASQGTTRELRLPLAAWTRYIVAVADDDRSGTGDVEIVIQGPGVLPTTAIAVGPAGSGALANRSLDVPEDSDFFRFTAPADADGTLAVTVSPWAGLDAAAILFDAEGHELARSYLAGAGADEVVAFNGVVPSTTYYLTVLSKDYADEGSYDVSLQFGLVRGSIRGTKFYDLDQDGVFDETEPGLAGWVIYADRNGNQQYDPGIDPFDETDLLGAYQLEDLPLGVHKVYEVPRAGWSPTAPLGGSHHVELTIGAPDAAGVDFGNHAPPQIQGLKWDDLDGDGKRDPGEPGLAGWTIYLDQDGDGQLDPGETAALTNQNGDYAFGGLVPGTYAVTEVLPADWVRTFPAAPGLYSVDVPAVGLVDNLDFGNYRYGVVDGVVYNDLDGDGLCDQGEPGLEGWFAFVDLDGDGTRTPGDPWDTTDPGGVYRIENVPPGTWKVYAEMMGYPGYDYTNPASGYHEIVFSSGSLQSDLDFGNLEILDFGDAPWPYPTLLADDGARHRRSGLRLGGVDHEPDGLPSASADGDNTTGSNDERGITFLTALVPGQAAQLRPDSYRDGTLDAWLDFNRDGDWDDPGERIMDHQSLAGEPQPVLSFNVPGWSVPGPTYGRFRYSYLGVASYTGPADSGEVEDYRVEIANPFNVPLVVPPLEDYGPMNQFGDRRVTFTLDSPTDRATWRFTTKAGGPATFTANADPSSGLHPLLALYNGKGSLVAVGSGGSDPSQNTLSYTLTPGVDEVYTLLVQDAELDTAGIVQSSFFDTPTVSSIDTIAVDAAGLGSALGTVITYTIPALADVDYYRLAPLGGGEPGLLNRLAVKVSPLESYRLEFQLFDGSGNPVGNRVLSPVAGQPAEHIYTGLPGGQSYFVAVFSHRFEDHPAGGDYRIDVDFDTYDFGDAPLSYGTLLADNGPRHLIVSGFYLGSRVDNEWEGQPGAAADGDDSAGSDDEDGVVFLEAMSPGHPTPIQVTASAAGMLDAWVDFNADGDFGDSGERVFASEPLVAGPNNLTVRVPVGATVGATYARFRLSSQGGLSFDGSAADGEVEDYRVTIEPSGAIHGTVWHDVNTDGTRGTSEPGLAGWTVFLDEDNDSQLDSGERSDVTDSGGNYAFLDVMPGNYEVAQVVQPGWLQTLPVVVPEWIYVAVEPNWEQPANRGLQIFDFDLNEVDFIEHDEFEEGSVRDVEIGPGGDVYVGLDTGEGGEIVQLTYDGEFLRVIDLPADTPPDPEAEIRDYPYGFDVLPDGSLLVAQPNNRQILRLNPDGSLDTTWILLGDVRPGDVGMLSDGTPVFTDIGPLARRDWEFMLNVRPEDQFWVGGPWEFQLRDRLGDVFASRPLGPSGLAWAYDALETGDGRVFATASINANGFRTAVVKYEAGAEEYVHSWVEGAYAFGLAVGRNEVPYGDGPVRGGAAPQGLIPFPPASSPVNSGRGSWSVVVGPGQIVEGADFGNVQESTASGVKFNDLDGDGTRDTNEPGLDGWVIWADLDDDGVRDGREPSATTSGGGRFTLEGILPGTCKIREEVRAGWTQTAPALGYHEVTFTSGSAITGLEFGNRQLFHVFVVNSTADPGDGTPNAAETTLREAITAANATANLLEPDRIVFDVPAGDPGHVYYRDDGVAGRVSSAQIAATTAADDSLLLDADPEWAHSWFSIRPATDLPWISDPVVIDGSSQSGSRVNTNAVESMRGLNSVLRIELDDGAAPGSGLFLDSPAGGSTVRGLVINRSHGLGIVLSKGNGHVIEGSYIGTDPSGSLDLGNVAGLYVGWSGSSGNLIGGLTPAARNLISGNSGDGMRAITTGNRVQGNLIGTDRSGARAIRNDSDAVELAANANVVGGTERGSRNVLSGNGFNGVFITGSNNLVQGNFIGTDVTGTAALGNGLYGVRVASTANMIGDDGAQGVVAGRNVISANLQGGISIESATGTRVQGNFIGTDVTGTADLGNGFDVSGGRYGGVIVYLAADSLIGGIEPGAGNRIAFNAGDGVLIRSTTGHAILGNSIHSNGGLGIDLGVNDDGVTPNDPGDSDAGANNLQNFPVLTSPVTATASSTSVQGSLNSTPNTAFRIELFAGEAADPAGFGEGQTLLGSIDVMTDPAGVAGFAAAFPTSLPPGRFVTATATVLRSGSNPGFGDTSEFSQARAVEVARGEIRGNVWHDVDTDGQRGTDEPGLAGRTVFLDDDHDGQLDSSERAVQTDSGGNYAFLNVTPGNYEVAQIDPFGWHRTFPVVVPETVYALHRIFAVDPPVELNSVWTFDFDLNLLDTHPSQRLQEGVPRDIEIGPGGDVYVLVSGFDVLSGRDDGDDRIVQFTYDMEFVRVIDLDDEEFVQPKGFDVLPDGSLLVAQWNNDQIVHLNPDGSIAETFPFPLEFLTDAGMTSDGDVVVCQGYLLNVRPDDLIWVSGNRTVLQDIAGTEFAERPASEEALETNDGSLFMVTFWGQGLCKLDAAGEELAYFDFDPDRVSDYIALAVARNEVPYGDGPVRGAAAPQGFIAVGPEGNRLVTDVTVTGASETPLRTPAKPVQTGRGSWSVVVQPGQVVEGVDFGNVQESTASGVKFHDLDGDGTRDSSEPGLDGWVVWADLDDDGVRDGREPFDTTHDGGRFALEGLLPGTVKLREEPKTPWVQTAPAAGFLEVTVVSGSSTAGLEFGNRWPGHVFVVNSTADPGDGTPNAAELTLREAIAAANATANLTVPDLIAFNVPAGDPGHVYYRNDGLPGKVSASYVTATAAADDSLLADPDPDWPHSWFSIQAASALPSIADPAIVDGTSQPGARPNTSGAEALVGLNGVLKIELNGSLAGTGGGLTLEAAARVRGLAINRFTTAGHGILLASGDGHAIEGNFLGTDPSGTLDLGNTAGVVIAATSSQNLIGGLAPAARNLISGNAQEGIRIAGAANRVQGNLIGTDRSGTRALRNDGWNVEIVADDNTLGGDVAGARNVIAGNAGVGLAITGKGNAVQGNFIGTDVTGTLDLGSFSNGVQINAGSQNNTIGGIAARPGTAPGNVISGNDYNGVVILAGATGNLVQGNLIGLNAAGTAALGNSRNGVIIENAPNNTIGGAVAGSRNVISGNREGVLITKPLATGNLVQGNFIGTDVTGTVDLGNTDEGVHVNEASSNVIGGTTAGAGNLISGNNRSGVSIIGTSVHTRNQVLGNRIGTDVTGTVPLGNTFYGVVLQGVRDTAVGGAAPGAGNTIAFNGLAGVFVTSTSAIRNAILSNSIFSNGALGIDLAPAGPNSPQDPGDPDTGANNLQNFPVLSWIAATATHTGVQGTLNSTPNQKFRIEFFASAAMDPTGFGEGQTCFGSIDVTTTSSGDAAFSATFPTGLSSSQLVTATATVLSGTTGNPVFGDTSEFSQGKQVEKPLFAGVEGMKFHDLDGDGLRDAGEPGLAGWVIYVDLDDDGLRDNGEPFATTRGNGSYAIGGILPLTYKVREEGQAGWSPTYPAAGYHEVHFLPGSMMEDLDFGNRLTRADFGDAPASYSTLWADDGAWHAITSNVRLGNAIDAEPDGQPHPTAEGDDLADADDEDGVTLGALVAGHLAHVTVQTTGVGFVSAWVDWNQDGDWADPGEQVLVDRRVELPNFIFSFDFAIPEAALAGPTFARFRLSSQGGLSFHGPAPDGEVEDYQVFVDRPVEIHGSKWNDLDADGLWDEGEPGLEGWTIFLDADGDGRLDDGEIRTTTDASGNYALTGLAPGTYTVAEVQQESWNQTFPLHSLRRVSVDRFGNQGDGNSSSPAVGGHPFSVVFQSLATNLVPEDTNGRMDVFGVNAFTGGVDRVSVLNNGWQAWNDSFNPSVSAGVVAFESLSPLGPDDDNGVKDIYVFQPGWWLGPFSMEQVSINDAGEAANGESSHPSIGGWDGAMPGRFVAFESDATNLAGEDLMGAPLDTNGVTDVFLFDRFSRSIHCLSVAGGIAFNQGNLPSMRPAISGDGQWVAFESFANNLVPGDTNGTLDIFVVERTPFHIERVSVGRQGDQEIEADGDSQAASISDDGRFIAFTSAATNLVPGDTNGFRDIFVFDRQSRTVDRVSVGRQGDQEIQADGPSFGPSISGDGRFVAFESLATNLAPEGDTNGERDVFVFDRQTRTIERVSVDGAGNQADRESFHPSISGDGRIVAFDSFATNLVPDDTNAARDVFVHEKYVHSVTLTSGQVADGLNFGNVCYPPSVSGLKYHDLDEDGSRDPGEPGLEGFVIYVDLNDNGVHEATEPFGTTHDGGQFAIAGDVPAGIHKVREAPQPGWAHTQPAVGFYELDFAPGSTFTDVLFGNRHTLDYGDAPLPYPTLSAAGGASHLIQPNFHLGIAVDDEPDGQPAAAADGDDTHAADDEDGVRFLTPLVRAQVAQIEVTASAPGALDAWIDFNADGDWADAGERIFTAQPLVAGPNPLSFMVPSFAMGDTFARFRFSPDGVDSYSGPGPAGEVEDYSLRIGSRVEHLGTVDLRQLDGLDPSPGDLWYRLQPVRAGILTLLAAGSGSGNVALALYDDRGNLLGESPQAGPSQRLDHTGAAGAVYYVRLSGTSTDVDLRVVNLLTKSSLVVSVFGTDGGDQFELSPTGSWRITIDAVDYTFDEATVAVISFDGGPGADSAVLFGSAASETATFDPGFATLTGPGLKATVGNVEEITIWGEGGQDVARLYDSAGDDAFEASPASARLSGSGFSNQANNFRYAYAYASGGNDAATFQDSPGNDVFVGDPVRRYAALYGGAFYLRANAFDSVAADSTAGIDLAKLYDSSGDDTFAADAAFARLDGNGFSNRVNRFRYAIGYASGGNDTATLGGSGQTDTFVGTPAFSTFSATGFYNRASSFETVIAGGTPAADDVARLYDSSGNDALAARPKDVTLSGTGFSIQAKDFRFVQAYSTTGGTDTADLYDSAGNDTFTASPAYAVMYGSDYYNRANYFDSATGHRSGGTDLAKLYDSPGDDLFEAYADYVRFYGTGFSNRAEGFRSVQAFSTAGGLDTANLHGTSEGDTVTGTPDYVRLQNATVDATARGFKKNYVLSGNGGQDKAILYDSLSDDRLEASGKWARLSYADRFLDVSELTSLAKVTAISSRGGHDTKQVQATDFVLETVGPWW